MKKILVLRHRFTLPIVIGILLTLHAVGLLDKTLSSFYKNKIEQANTDYLHGSIERNRDTLYTVDRLNNSIETLENDYRRLSLVDQIETEFIKLFYSLSDSTSYIKKGLAISLATLYGFDFILTAANLISKRVMWLFLIIALIYSLTRKWASYFAIGDWSVGIIPMQVCTAFTPAGAIMISAAFAKVDAADKTSDRTSIQCTVLLEIII